MYAAALDLDKFAYTFEIGFRFSAASSSSSGVFRLALFDVRHVLSLAPGQCNTSDADVHSPARSPMTVPSSRNPLVLAVTPHALFDLREGSQAAGHDGQAAHGAFRRTCEATPLRPGSAFTLVRKLLALNTAGCQRVEVILVSTDSADAGLRVLRALGQHGLPITRAAFTRGAPSHRYAAAFGAHLFLSTDANEVGLALDQGMAAATVVEGAATEPGDAVVRIAFDGDAVLFSDEAEQVYTHSGLEAFIRSEQEARHVPLAPGPLRQFLAHLHRLQTSYGRDTCPIRTALVTARSVSAHERALRTLQAWRLEVDEAMFLGGADKGPLLRGFGADIFFDDRQPNCDRAAAFVPCAHVPYGIKNRPVRPALRRVA
jgi:5'-nucleotidase